jgi:thiamine-monophosphate kinase
MALHGGEDYELLFTAPASAKLPRSIRKVAITEIGRILPAKAKLPRVSLRTETATEPPQPLEPHGWEHFSTEN